MNLRSEMVFLSEPYAVSGKTGQIWVLVANVLSGPQIIHYGVDMDVGALPQTEINNVIDELAKQAFNRLGWVEDKRCRCGWRKVLSRVK